MLQCCFNRTGAVRIGLVDGSGCSVRWQCLAEGGVEVITSTSASHLTASDYGYSERIEPSQFRYRCILAYLLCLTCGGAGALRFQLLVQFA